MNKQGHIRKISFLIFYLLLLSVKGISQRSWFVKPGINSGDTTSTISAAVIKASNSDTLILYPGTYNEVVNVTDKSLVIASFFIRDRDINTIGNTIIDGTGITDLFLKSTNWSEREIKIYGITVQNFQNQISPEYISLKLYNSVFKSNGGSDYFINTYRPIEIKNCEFNSNNGRFYLRNWDINNKQILEQNKFINHNLGNSGWYGDGTGLLDINDRGKYFIRNNLFYNCSGTGSGFVIKLNLNEVDSAHIINNSFLNNDIGTLKILNSKPNVIFQNNLLNQNNRNSATELSFTTAAKVSFRNNVTFLNLNKYSGFNLLDTSSSSINFILQDLKLVNKNNSTETRDKFYPSSNSPFIGLGKIDGAPIIDLDGVSRPNPVGTAPEIGAFETPLSLTPPVLKALEANRTKITLTWTKNQGEKDSKVNIYRSSTGIAKSFQKIGFALITDGNAYIDSLNIQIGIKYFYAVSLEGQVADTSILSNVLNVTPVSIPPSTPENLVASSSPSRIKLNWTKINSADTIKYNIYRSMAGGVQALYQSGIVDNSFVDTIVLRSKSYKYQVRAVNKENNASDLSAEVTISTDGKRWFVSNTGKDLDIGSELYPFNTLSYALKNINIGDTILLKKGTYAETLSNNYTIDSSITIMSYFPLNADSSFLKETILDGSNMSTNIAMFNGLANRYNFQGIYFKNFPGRFMVDEKTIVIEKSILENISFNNNWDHSLLLANNSVLKNNIFKQIYGFIRVKFSSNIDGNQFILNNMSYSWQNDAKIRFETYGIRNKVYFTNNLVIYDKTFLNLNSNNSSDSLFILNNTFIYKGNSTDNYSLYFNNNSYKTYVKNNIFYPRNNIFYGPYNQNNSNVHLYITNNILSNGLATANADFLNFNIKDTTSNIYSSDPKFTSLATGDFSLSNASIGLGKGVLDRSLYKDIKGLNRPLPQNSLPDIGAFENRFSIAAPKIKAAEGSDKKITISWTVDNADGLDSFHVYRTGPNFDNTLDQTEFYKSFFKDSLSFIDSVGIINKDKYYYRVKSVDAFGNESDTSNLMLGRANIQPIGITNLNGNASPSLIMLKWEHADMTNVKFNIYRGTSNNSKIIISTNVNTNNFIDSTVSRGVTYFYSVKAVDSVGASSEFSSSIEIATRGVKWHVDTAGSNNGIGSLLNPFKTIARVLKFVLPNDTISLSKGIYKEQLKFKIKPLFFVSNYANNFLEEDITNTIIDGSNLSSTTQLLVDSSQNNIDRIYFTGLTFTKAPTYVFNFTKAIFTKCVFNENRSSNGVFAGSYIVIDSSKITNNGPNSNNYTCCNAFSNFGDSTIIRNSIIEYNTCRDDALLKFESYENRKSYSPVIESNIFRFNKSLNSWSNVNVIKFNSRNALIKNNIFVNNEIYPIGLNPNNWDNNSVASQDIINNTIVSNKREALRLEVNGRGRVNIYNNIFQNNLNEISIEGSNSINPVKVEFVNNIIGLQSIPSAINKLTNIGNVDTSDSQNNIGDLFNFADTLRGNFNLKGSSITFGRGSARISNTNDFYGNSRPNPIGSNPDIGAIESAYSISSPIIYNIEGSNNKIKLEWDHSTTNNLLKYYIYRSTTNIDSSTTLVIHDSITNDKSSYIDSINVINLTKYFYRIKSVALGYSTSSYSNQVIATPNKPLGPPDSLSLLAAPRNIKIKWVDSTGNAKSFSLYKGTSEDNLRLYKSGIVDNFYEDASVFKNITYYYAVKSIDSVGSISSSSAIVSGKFNRNIFYVDNNFTVSGIGDVTNPINSIQLAIQKAIGGDTIIINPGTYYERLSIDSSIVIGSKFLLNNDTNFISNTIINGSKIINFTSFIGSKNNNYIFNSNKLGLIGISFTQFQNAFVDNSRRLNIDNCKFISIGSGCSTLINLSDSSYIRGTQFINCGGAINLNSNNEISRSIFRNQNSFCGNGLINANGSKTRIYNNIFYNTYANDLYLSGSDSNFVFHNTFYKEPNNTYQFIRFDSYNNAKNYIYNNIFYKKSGQDFIFNMIYNGDSSRSVLDISYNLINKALSENQGYSSYKSYNSRNNFVNLNPSFTNASNFQFSLKKSSQAIGIGLDSIFLPQFDYNNTLRPNPVGSKPDLGAIESEVGIAGPDIYAITATDRLVKLSWRVIDTSGITKYRVYKSSIDSLPTTLIFESSTQNVTSILDSIVSYDSVYTYRVKSVKLNQITSDFSDPVKINIYKSPSIVKPIDSSYYFNLIDTIKWSAVNSSVNYSIELSKSPNFIIKDSFLTKNTFLPLSNLKQNTNYYWRIKVADNISSSLWSNANYFQTIINKPIISDTISVYADTFNLKFKFDTSNIKFVNIYKSINDTNYNLYKQISKSNIFVDTLKFDTFNYFKIQLINQEGKLSDSSNSVKVITYSIPNLGIPANNTTGLVLKPTFTWSHPIQTTRSNIQISRDSIFGNFIAGYDTVVSTKTFTITDSNKIVPNTNYYWRVRVGDKNGYSKWTNSSLFQTKIESPIFNSIKVGNKKDTLFWTLRGDSVRYLKSYIYRDTIPNPTILLDSVNNSTSFYIDTNNLRLNVKYYYRIKAVNIERIISDYSIDLTATPFNIKPVAKGLVDKTYKDVGIYSSVRLNQTSLNSFDVDGKIINVKWFVNDSLVNTGDSLLVYYYRQGSNRLKMVVVDNDGDSDSTSALITLSSFEKPFKAGFLGGITAVSPNIIYTADTSFDPVNGSSISMLDRNGNSIYPLVVSSKIFTTPSVASDSSVFITSGSSLNGFSKTGVPLWSTIPLGGLSFVTPTIDSLFSRIYVGVSNKNFFAIDYKSGKVAWNIIGDAPINASAVITGDRKLVFTSQSGTLYGFDIRTSNIQTAAKWSTNFGENVIKSPAVDLLNNLIFGTESGKVVKVKLNNDGSVSRLWTVNINAAIQTSPVIDADGYIYIGNQAGDFYKLNPDNGDVIWKYATGAAIKSTPSISEFGSIYISNTSGVVTSLTSQKEVKWIYQSGGPISANMLYINNMLYVGTENGKFFAIYDNPTNNTINTSLSINLDPNRLKTFNFGSMASAKSFSLNEEESSYYFDEFKKGNFSFDFTNDLNIEKEPVWGTFQGNYRRTGSKAFECPDVPIVKVPNCLESDDLIKISTSNLVNKFWVVNDVILNTVTDTSIYVKPTDKFKVMAYNANGCTVYSSDPIKIVNSSIAKPQIITNTGSTKFCEGDSIVLSSSISANSFKWNYLSTSVDGATNKSLTTNLQGAYSITAINEYGCKSTSDIALILSTPKIPIASIEGNNASCVGSTIKLSNVTTGGSWSSSIQSIATIDNLGNLTTKSSGNTIISYTINNNGCINSSQLNFRVNANPVAPKVENAEFCVGGVASPLNGNALGGNTLMWYGTNSIGGEASGTAPIPTTNKVGKFNYFVSQTSLTTGCESPRSNISVIINEIPTAPTVTNATYCLGATTSALSATAISGSTLNWYGTNATGGTASGSAPTPSTTTAGTLTYYVSQVATSTGCESPRSTIGVTINALPTAPTVTNATYCVGATASALSATAISGSTLNWYGTNATGGTASTNAPLPSTTSAGTLNYYVSQVATSTGCESPRSTLGVTINALPTAPTVTNATYCIGGTSTALGATALGGHSLLWYGSNATGGESSGTSPIPSTNVQGSIDYYVSQSNNSTSCESPRTKVTVSVGPAPATPIITREASGNLISSASNSNQWYKNGAEIIGAISRTYKPTEAANYSVKIQGACVSPMSSSYYFLVTDIINLSATEFIKLVPNPFINFVNIDFVVKGHQRLNIEVFSSATGTKVASRIGVTAGSRLTFSELTPGVYFVRVTSADLKISRQFKMVKL
jgi:fibronectin type 3 domain-containing protein